MHVSGSISMSQSHWTAVLELKCTKNLMYMWLEQEVIATPVLTIKQSSCICNDEDSVQDAVCDLPLTAGDAICDILKLCCYSTGSIHQMLI